MSDTQDPLIVLQRRVQQRQILAMMGIKQWVQPSSDTINVADISAPTVSNTVTPSTSSEASIEQPSINELSAEALTIDALNTDIADRHAGSHEPVDIGLGSVDENAISSDYPNVPDDGFDSTSTPSYEQSPVTYSFDTTTPNIATAIPVNTPAQQTTALAEQTDATEPRYDNLLKVAPFDLQGGRYGNWVVLVDIQALNNESQKLWNNITQALSITCETTSFPICEGMDTAELANASLAGYVFKIGRSEDIQVAALTTLPEGLEHPNLTDTPILDEMLIDSSLKRQLWAQISAQV